MSHFIMRGSRVWEPALQLFRTTISVLIPDRYFYVVIAWVGDESEPTFDVCQVQDTPLDDLTHVLGLLAFLGVLEGTCPEHGFEWVNASPYEQEFEQEVRVAYVTDIQNDDPEDVPPPVSGVIA